MNETFTRLPFPTLVLGDGGYPVEMNYPSAVLWASFGVLLAFGLLLFLAAFVKWRKQRLTRTALKCDHNKNQGDTSGNQPHIDRK